jgi:hypothetical protein
MKNTEKIIEFLDGSLRQESETELYRSLLENEYMRQEMRNHISIKNAVKADFKAFNPSPASTLNIFGTLGFSAPMGAVNSTGNSTGGTIISFFSKNKLSILYNILSAVIGGILVFLFLKQNGDFKNELVNNNSNILNNSSSSFSKNNQSNPNNEQQNGTNNNLNQNNEKIKVVTKYIYLEKKNNNIPDLVNTKEISSETASPFSEISSAKPAILAYQDFNSGLNNKSNSPFERELSGKNLQNGQIFNINTILNKLNQIGISAEFTGNQFFQTMDENIEPSKIQLFNNNSLNLLYSISDNFKTGLSLRRENFFQTFTGTDSLGNTYRYEQKPNLTSIGLVNRFNPFRTETLSPFIQFEIGFNSGGLLGRGAIGTEIKAYSGLSFIIGLDYSYMVYSHQNQYFTTNKIGLNYGIAFSY